MMRSASLDARRLASNFGILALLGLLVSPPLANLAEALMFGLVLANADLRRSLLATWRYPLVRFVAAFFLVMLLGSLYSLASPGEIRHSLLGWLHRLLLVPFALAVCERPADKERMVRAYAAAAMLFATVSFVCWTAGFSLNPEQPPGIILRNHATQGMGFAVAVLLALHLAFSTPAKKTQAAWLAGGLLLALNIAFVSTGRSGYVVLLIGIAGFFATRVLAASSRQASGRLLLGGLAALGLTALLLASAPSSRERLERGMNEVQGAAQATEYTSMGIRMVFWRNTLEMIRAQPLLGYGSGSFAAAYKAKIAGETGFRATETGDPHNQYMKIATENGLVGLLAFLGIIGAALLTRAAMPWRMLAVGVLLSWCVTSLFNAHFSTFAEGHFVYLWLGFMLAMPPASAKPAA